MESEIQQFYENSTILLTGGTGFLGKLLLEKLLRGCPGIKRIYLVVREKDGKKPLERFNNIFQSPVFKNLKEASTKLFEKVTLIEGDALKSSYGFSEKTQEIILKEVDVIINNASCNNFNASLKNAFKVNISSLNFLLGLVKTSKKLKAFVQISSIYTNFPQSEIEEVICDPSMTLEKLNLLLETSQEDFLEVNRGKYLGDFPNVFVFTKAVAEGLLKKYKGLPVCLVRAPMILSTYSEPFPGWNETLSGPAKMSLAFLTGIFHIPLVRKSATAELIPADFVVNAIIAAAWSSKNKDSMKDKVEKYQSTINEEIFLETQKTSEVPVFNVITSTLNGITWEEFWMNLRHLSDSFPSKEMLWFPYIFITQCKFIYLFFMYFFHFIPAFILDGFLAIFGQPKKYLKIVKDMHEMSLSMQPFTSKEFIVLNNNTINLWNNMKETDKKLFSFDVAKLKWRQFLIQHVAGCRQHLTNECLENMNDAISKHRKLKVLNAVLTMFLVYLFVKACMCTYHHF